MARKRVCIIGAGPCGLSALYQLAKDPKPDVEVVCYEKQEKLGGRLNYTWRTGTDRYGEPCLPGRYRLQWLSKPKECLEYPDYTFETHFSRPIPSFPPISVVRDYMEGRCKTIGMKIERCIQFNTNVRLVEYIDDQDCFRVRTTNMFTGKDDVQMFSHVVVAVGILNIPKKPDFKGIETFPGRVLHGHDFRHAEEFRGQRVMIVGSTRMAADLALECKKFGSQKVVCTSKSKPMGFKWPDDIKELPALQTIHGKKVTFKDGSEEEFDSIILCTGFLYAFPFMERRLRLRSSLSLYPDKLYKGSVLLEEGNNKLFYMGTQEKYYSFTMYDVQAAWIVKFIIGSLKNEPASRDVMETDVQSWVNRKKKLESRYDDIEFQTSFVSDLAMIVGYNPDVVKAGPMLKMLEENKEKDIISYRDKSFRSIYTGNESPLPKTTWLKSFDDSTQEFLRK